MQTGADGKPLRPARLVDGTGIGQVTLEYTTPGMTVIANSLSQQTTYRHAIIGGQYQLLEARGAGCSQCGETNVRYNYDRLGRQTDRTRLTRDGRPIQSVRTELDAFGRPVKISTIHFHDGKAGQAQWQVHYEYAGNSKPLPTLSARPSVVPGQEHQIRINYRMVKRNMRPNVPTMKSTHWAKLRGCDAGSARLTMTMSALHC